MIVQTDGVDFTELSPRALAVALFVVLPAAFGAALEPTYQFLRSRITKLPVIALTALAVPRHAPAQMCEDPRLVERIRRAGR